MKLFVPQKERIDIPMCYPNLYFSHLNANVFPNVALLEQIFTAPAPSQILSIIRDVRLSSLYVVPSWKPCFLVDWRPLVKEQIANIG